MRMIKESDGERFECARSLNQSLTFVTAQQEFQRRGIPLEEAQQRSLQLVTADGLYTNLALLLSDQCPFTIKVARFSGTDKYIFQDRAEFSGLHRIDRRDYPDEALREALLNAAIHRDYSYHSSILISIFDDRAERESRLSLLPPPAGGSLWHGASPHQPPYKKAARKPEIHVSENAFKIVLPNQNTSSTSTTGEYLEISEPEASYHTSQPVQPAPLHHQRVLDYLSTHPTITRPQAERLLTVSQATAARLLARMTSEGNLQRLGQGRDTYYQLPR